MQIEWNLTIYREDGKQIYIVILILFKHSVLSMLHSEALIARPSARCPSWAARSLRALGRHRRLLNPCRSQLRPVHRSQNGFMFVLWWARQMLNFSFCNYHQSSIVIRPVVPLCCWFSKASTPHLYHAGHEAEHFSFAGSTWLSFSLGCLGLRSWGSFHRIPSLRIGWRRQKCSKCSKRDHEPGFRVDHGRLGIVSFETEKRTAGKSFDRDSLKMFVPTWSIFPCFFIFQSFSWLSLNPWIVGTVPQSRWC